MLHVVHVLHSLGVGGTENGVVNLIGALGEDFLHTVISVTDVGLLAARLPPSVAVHSLHKRPGIDAGSFVGLTVLLRRLRPDIVHSRNWAAFDAVPAARLARVPVVIHGEHGREATDPHGLNRKRNRIRRLVGGLVDRFVTVSDDLRRWLIVTVGVPEEKVLRIPNGVDTIRFRDDGREARRRTLGIPSDTIVIGTVGRLDPVKDQMGLLDAFALLNGGGPPRVLVIVWDGPCRAALEARARRSDLAGQVWILGERPDVPVLLKEFDVFVLPSIAEGISNTILEAMATGLPVIATRTGGNPELVEDGVTGALVPVGEPRRLAQTLEAYLRDAHLRALHGKAGRQRAVEQFSLERMTKGYRDLYLSLARGQGIRRP